MRKKKAIIVALRGEKYSLKADYTTGIITLHKNRRGLGKGIVVSKVSGLKTVINKAKKSCRTYTAWAGEKMYLECEKNIVLVEIDEVQLYYTPRQIARLAGFKPTQKKHS